MNPFEKLIKDLSGLYPALKISPSKLAADIPFPDFGTTLKIDSEFDPEDWTVIEKAGDVIKVKDVKGAFRLILAEFIGVFNEFKADVKGKPESVTQEADIEPDGEPQERLSDADKLAELEKIMNGEAAPVRVPAKRDKPVSKVPALIPINVRSKQIAELTNADIINYICPNANEKEAMIFLKLCQARGINPFLKEAYLVKYKQEDPASIVVAKDYFARKAEENQMYDGEESGIILLTKDGTIERREGAFMLPNENLVGGWCKVYRKDRTRPVLTEVAFQEYVQKTREGTPNKFWSKMQATMIQKVAFSQCHRKAFPGEFSGMYDVSEIEGSMEGIEDSIIEANYEEVEA